VATFAVGQTITTSVPSIAVDAGLRLGGHRFQLVVVTADGRKSPPDTATVNVTEQTIGPVIGTITTPISPVIITRDITPR
jgi:hypothetical protein